MFSDLLFRIRALISRSAVERELDEELGFHVEHQVQSYMDSGLSHDEAMRKARIAFGGLDQVKEECREARGISWIESLAQNLRFTFRTLRKSPGFAAMCILTLAIGIGANIAIFGVVRAVLLKPLPYQDSGRLVTLWQSDPQKSIHQQLVTPANFVDWRRQNHVFENLALSTAWDGSNHFNIVGREGDYRVAGATVSAALFSLLRVQPMLGRAFTSEEDRVGGPLAALISYDIWQREFGRDPSIIGKTLKVDTYGLRNYTVVGVMQPSFHFPDSSAEVWLNIGWMGGIELPSPDASDRCCSWYNVVGRLKPGVSLEQARVEMNLIARRIQQHHPETRFGPTVEVIPMLDEMTEPVRRQLLLLLSAVGCILSIGCANIANLLLSKAATRRREFAVRIALGAGRKALVAQLLTESCTLAFIGGIAGLTLAIWSVHVFAVVVGDQIPRGAEAQIDAVVLCFAFLISLVTGILSGLGPALQFSKSNLNEALKSGAHRNAQSAERIRLRDFLVISEVALTLVMLSSAGLLLRSFAKLSGVNPGFRADHVLTMSIDMTSSVYADRESSRVLFRQLMNRVESMPGVLAVGGTTELPLLRDWIGQAITIEGQPLRAFSDSPQARTMGATAGYFRAMGVPLLKGRIFTDTSRRSSHPDVVINQIMARRYWPGLPLDQVLGKRIVIGSRDRIGRIGSAELDWMTIVGIVGDVREISLDAAPIPELYLSFRQWPWYDVGLVVRSASDHNPLAGAIRSELRSISKNAIITQTRTMEQLISQSTTQPRIRTILLAGFAIIALFLAALGIYGVIAYSVEQRTYEIGVRMALGAQRSDVLRLIVSQGMAPIGIGIAVGFALSIASSYLLSHFLFEVSGRDVAALSGAMSLLVLVALLAMYFPARRAIRIDPVLAIRAE